MTQEEYNNQIYLHTLLVERVSGYFQITAAIIGVIIALYLLRKHG